jgi:hypothetical protein
MHSALARDLGGANDWCELMVAQWIVFGFGRIKNAVGLWIFQTRSAYHVMFTLDACS